MKAFFQKWLAAFDSKKFKALTLTWGGGVLVLVLIGVGKAAGVNIGDDMIQKAVDWIIGGLFGTSTSYMLAQGYADAKTDGKTSSVVPSPLTPEQVKAEIRAAAIEWLKSQNPPG